MKFLLPFLYSFIISTLAIFFVLRAEKNPRAQLSEMFLELSSRKKRLGGVIVIAVSVLMVCWTEIWSSRVRSPGFWLGDS